MNFPFKQNNLRIEFAATSFDNESASLYQYYLEDFDEDWSPWTLETKKDYTNVPEGDYVFRVRAKNIYGHFGKEDSYIFTVLPPWYRMWWAYLIYTLGGVILLRLYMQYRSRQLRAKNMALAALIEERTEEIRRKK